MSNPLKKRPAYGCALTAAGLGAGILATTLYFGIGFVNRYNEDAPERERLARQEVREAQIDSAIASKRFDLAKDLVAMCESEKDACLPANRRLEVAYDLKQAITADSIHAINTARAQAQAQEQARIRRERKAAQERADSIANANRARADAIAAAERSRIDSTRAVYRSTIESQLEAAIAVGDTVIAKERLRTLVDSSWSPPGRTRQYLRRMGVRQTPPPANEEPEKGQLPPEVDTTGYGSNVVARPPPTSSAQPNSGIGTALIALNGRIAEYASGANVVEAMRTFVDALQQAYPTSTPNPALKRTCDQVRSNLVAYRRAATTLPIGLVENAIVAVNGRVIPADQQNQPHAQYIAERTAAIPRGARGRVIAISDQSAYVFFPAYRDVDFRSPRSPMHQSLLATRKGVVAYDPREIGVIASLAPGQALNEIMALYASSRCATVSPWRSR